MLRIKGFLVVGLCRKGKEKEDYSTAILERKKSPNLLIIDEATNDDKTRPQQYSAPQGDIFLLLRDAELISRGQEPICA